MSVPKIRTSKPRRGTILLSVMSFVLILVIFTALGTHKFQSDSRTGLAYEMKSKGKYVSQSGLQLALEQLHLDPDWPSPQTSQTLTLDVSPDGRLQAKLLVFNNSSGTTVETTPEGVAVGPGQVYIDSTAIVEGREILGSFGQASSLLVQPPVEFKHAVFDNDHGVAQQAGDAWADAYDSDLGENPTAIYNWSVGQPDQPSTTPPYDGRGGSSIRSGGTLSSNLITYGDLYLPTGGILKNSNQVGGSVIRLDDPHIPLVFKVPIHLESDMTSPFTPGVPLPPGNYGDVNVPDHSVMILQRGDFRFDVLTLGEGSRVVLEEDTDVPPAPTRIYLTQESDWDRDCLINMEPEFPGAVEPQAAELQIFGTDGPGASKTIIRVMNGVRVRAAMAGYGLDIIIAKDEPSGLSPLSTGTISPAGRHGIDFFGAIYAASLGHEPGVRYHYDKALAKLSMPGLTQWVLSNQGNLR